jgi:pyruvate-ferredoxin/flavodoxin oxidoreductase
MVSGKPVRVIVLDTQEDSSTGGHASTTRFGENRKELALLAMAHRNAFVLQSSQASPAHLLGGLLKGLRSPHPAVFILHCPCPPDHGFGERSAFQAAKLALESRAFPLLLYDPDLGPTFPDRLSLEGNPAPEQRWPEYELKRRDDEGNEDSVSLPLTIADWAATEGRFRREFSELPPDTPVDDLVPFADYLDLPADEREDKRPFIYVLHESKHLERLLVSDKIVALAEERLQHWSLLRQLAAIEFPATVRKNLGSEIEAEFDKKADALRAEYEAKLSQLKTEYPWLIARRLAAGLLQTDNGGATISDILAKADIKPADLVGLDFTKEFGPAAARSESAAEGGVVVAEAAPAAAAADVAVEEEELVMDPYIESARCTSCDECTRLNGRMFAYDANKQAYIKDKNAGTFKELVIAAEKCPVGIIHPGQPLNPDEKDLDKLIKRAERFN